MNTTTMNNNNNNNKKEKLNPGAGAGGGGSTSGQPDRISELPVEILHRILGFLEMDELLIGTSLVSTKWRYLWKSVSTLNFPICITSRRRTDDDSVVVDNGGGIRNNVEKYQNFVDHVLRLRDSQASKIQIFRYCCHDSNPREGGGGGGGGGYEDYLERLHNFVVSAVVNQGAQEILIICSFHFNPSIFNSREGGGGNNNNRIIHFNPSIFTSLIRKFTFELLNCHYLIQFPRSMCCATQLRHLDLNNIRLPEGDDESNAELHLVCPLLETFHMSCCSSEHLKVLDISAPRLDFLSIDNTGMRRRRFDGFGGCRIEIRTPNLTSLVYEGCVYVDCFTDNLPLLAYASLDFTKEPDMVEQTTSFATKLLKGLTSVESLTLEGFEVFSQDTLKVLLSPFTSLRTLELKCSCKVSASIHVMVHILHICNSVEKFVWDVNEFVEVEGDEDLMLPQCRLSHLKHVHIKRLRGHENEIEFVKFLVKSFVVLEDIVINNTIKNSSKRLIFEEKLQQFIGEELSLRSIKLHIL